MKKLSVKAAVIATVISWEFLNVLMLLHLWMLGNSEQGHFQTLWLQGLYPGFVGLNFFGIVIALVQGFIWPWIFAWLFVRLYNHFLNES